MTNKEFATVLAIAVEKKKLNKSQLVDNFITTHKGDAEGKVMMDDAKKPTPEQIAFVNDFRKKRAKTKDSQLDDYFNKIVENASKPKAAAPKASNTSYRAQER